MDPKDFLDKTAVVTVDRPFGSQHPKFGFTYPLNYGFVAGVLAPVGSFTPTTSLKI
jgi:inorganic pyrophosphatase